MLRSEWVIGVWRNFDQWWDVTPAGCWEWKGRRTRHGYGYLYDSDNRRVLAHRFSYVRYVGPITAGLSVCHKCDNPCCVNPKHLFMGTHLDNMRDMCSKGRNGINGSKGEAIGTSKLKESDVVQIKRLLKTGATQVETAKMFGVTQAAISLIKVGIRWKHVEC